MKRALPLLTFVLAVTSPAVGQAQMLGAASSGRLEVSGFVGGMSFNQDLGMASNIYQRVTGSGDSIDFGKLYGFRGSWSFTPMLAAELNYAQGSHSYSFNVDDDVVGPVTLADQFDANVSIWSANAVVQFPLELGGGQLVPYGTIGVGVMESTPQQPIAGLEDASGAGVNVGGGVKFFFPRAHWLGVRFDVRYHSGSTGLTFPAGSGSSSGTDYTIGGIVRLF